MSPFPELRTSKVQRMMKAAPAECEKGEARRMSRLQQGVDEAIGRWLAAGVIDAPTAERLRSYEHARAPEHTGRTARLAFGFGGLLLAAGVLLFVAANWDLLSPWSRFGLLAGIVAVLHLGGAAGSRFSPALSTSLHAAGTAALGAGIFLSGQIFHLQEHWPQALLLWAVGAGFAALLLRDWPQVLWVAVLGPAWLAAEWGSLFPWYRLVTPGIAETVLSFGLVVLSAAYVAATGPGLDAAWRRALARLGAVGLVVAALSLASSGDALVRELGGNARPDDVPVALLALGWGVALGLPLGLAWLLRRREAWPVAAAAALAGIVVALDAAVTAQRLLIYLIYAVGSVGLVAWGFRDRERGRVNLGVLGFTLTVFAFSFSSLYDMLGRAAGLIGMGVLFIAGGWLAERVRRRLLARFEGAAP
jgi:uncharacterized membrane protein